VESAATKDGKYLWVSNYCMYGAGYTNPGCDTCCRKQYDASFVYKINTKTYKIENIIKVGSVPKYLSITPDQKKLLVSNWSSGDVSIIDLSTEKEIKRVSMGPAPRGIAFDTAGKYAYIAIMGSDKIMQLELESYKTHAVASGLLNPRHLCVQHNYLYASLNGEGAICRINLSNHQVKKLAVGKAPRSMVLSASKNKLFVNCYGESKVSIIDLNSFKLDSEIKTSSYPIGICLNNENEQVWVSCYLGYIQVFAEAGSPTGKL
jgi:YVTN family beta-propeller protein